MKKDRLEDFVRNNREEFDLLEPSEFMWEAISKKLEDGQAKKIQRPAWFRIAAAVVTLAMVGSGIFYMSLRNEKNQTIVVENPDPAIQELIEAEAYYAHEVSGKLAEIQKCYKVYPDLKSEIESDLNELETMYLSLKKDLNENISNREVIEAMIENNRNRMKLVDDVLEQINC